MNRPTRPRRAASCRRHSRCWPRRWRPAAATPGEARPARAASPSAAATSRLPRRRDPDLGAGAQESGYWQDRAILQNVLDRLLYRNAKTHAIEPWIAKSWKVSKGDGRRYEFVVRRRRAYSDGPGPRRRQRQAQPRLADQRRQEERDLPQPGVPAQGHGQRRPRGGARSRYELPEPYAPFLGVLTTWSAGLVADKTIATGRGTRRSPVQEPHRQRRLRRVDGAVRQEVRPDRAQGLHVDAAELEEPRRRLRRQRDDHPRAGGRRPARDAEVGAGRPAALHPAQRGEGPRRAGLRRHRRQRRRPQQPVVHPPDGRSVPSRTSASARRCSYGIDRQDARQGPLHPAQLVAPRRACSPPARSDTRTSRPSWPTTRPRRTGLLDEAGWTTRNASRLPHQGRATSSTS